MSEDFLVKNHSRVYGKTNPFWQHILVYLNMWVSHVSVLVYHVYECLCYFHSIDSFIFYHQYFQLKEEKMRARGAVPSSRPVPKRSLPSSASGSSSQSSSAVATRSAARGKPSSSTRGRSASKTTGKRWCQCLILAGKKIIWENRAINLRRCMNKYGHYYLARDFCAQKTFQAAFREQNEIFMKPMYNQ